MWLSYCKLCYNIREKEKFVFNVIIWSNELKTKPNATL